MIAFSFMMLLGSIQVGNGPAFWNYVPQTLEGAIGTVTILAPAPTMSVTSRTISPTNGGANITDANPQPAVTAAGNEIWWSGLVGDSGTLTDIDHVTIYIYKTGATKGTFDQLRSYGFRWVRRGYSQATPGASCAPGTGTPAGCFQELGGGGWVNTFTYFVSGDSSRPNTPTGTSGTWTFAATLANLALYADKNAASHWNYEVDVQSRSNPSHPLATKTGKFDMNLYMQIATASLNIANLTAVTPGAANASLGTTTWSYVSNAPLNAQVQANDLPTDEFADTIPIDTIMVGQVTPPGTCTSATCTKLSLTQQNYATNQANQASPVLNMYWYISPPNPMAPGTYTFTYVLSITWTGTYPS